MRAMTEQFGQSINRADDMRRSVTAQVQAGQGIEAIYRASSMGGFRREDTGLGRPAQVASTPRCAGVQRRFVRYALSAASMLAGSPGAMRPASAFEERAGFMVSLNGQQEIFHRLLAGSTSPTLCWPIDLHHASLIPR
jgi:hypothetical protein